jgi:hypothetical protein
MIPGILSIRMEGFLAKPGWIQAQEELKIPSPHGFRVPLFIYQVGLSQTLLHPHIYPDLTPSRGTWLVLKSATLPAKV